VGVLKKDFLKIRAKAYKMMRDNKPKPRIFAENSSKVTSVYWKQGKNLIMQAGEGRFDFARGFDEGIFGQDTVTKNPKLQEIMRHVMKSGFTSYGGVVHSESGSKDQYWHRDTSTLQNERSDGQELAGMDDFYFTVLIPITVPVDRHNGPTEFMAGSHRLPAQKFD
jgi:hypothetical protein